MAKKTRFYLQCNLRYSYSLENQNLRYSYLNSLHKILFGKRHPKNLRYIEFLRYSHLRYIECQLYYIESN